MLYINSSTLILYLQHIIHNARTNHKTINRYGNVKPYVGYSRVEKLLKM